MGKIKSIKKAPIIGEKKKVKPISMAELPKGSEFWCLDTKSRKQYPIKLVFVLDSMGIISCSFVRKPHQLICIATDFKDAETKFINQIKKQKNAIITDSGQTR